MGSDDKNKSKSGDFVGPKYKKQSAHQQRYNNENNDKLVILTTEHWFPLNSSETGLSICDLGCGHGQATIDLYDKLVASDVRIHEMIAYDLSPSQISEAKSLEVRPNLNFHVQDIQKMQDKNRFDIIYSWFTLHWMDDLEKTRNCIFQALKPGGHIVFLVPLEKPTLWNIREKLVSSPKWRSKFTNYQFKPFKLYNLSYVSGERGYEDVFSEIGNQDFQHTTRSIGVRTFEVEAFVAFLKSWMQELRVEVDGRPLLDDSKQDQYVRDVIKEIKITSPTQDADVKLLPNGLIEFHEHYVFSCWQKPFIPRSQANFWKLEQENRANPIVSSEIDSSLSFNIF